VFLTFCVIVVTLVFQGLTLPPLIRKLGLVETAGPPCEEQEAHRLVLQAAQKRLDEIRQNDAAGPVDVYDHLAQQYEHRLASIGGRSKEEEISHAGHYLRYLDLSRTLLEVERQAALRLRDEGRITDETWRRMENEMDLSETRLTVAIDHRT
jgi:CPA1 family monovalent cation:H+ antiporter